MPLTEIALKNAKPREKQYKLADSLGLFLLVTPKGARLWRFKYRFAGKEKLLALGAYPEVSLKEARERRDAARKLLADGQDPCAVKQSTRRCAHLDKKNAFQAVALEFTGKQDARWSEKHAADVAHRLRIYIFPKLGERPIGEITPQELLDVVRKIEARGATELAHRMV